MNKRRRIVNLYNCHDIEPKLAIRIASEGRRQRWMITSCLPMTRFPFRWLSKRFKTVVFGVSSRDSHMNLALKLYIRVNSGNEAKIPQYYLVCICTDPVVAETEQGDGGTSASVLNYGMDRTPSHVLWASSTF